MLGSFYTIYVNTEAVGELVVLNTPLTYRQAIQSCEIVYNGRLVRESDVRHFAHQLSENTNYWSDKYTSLSDWINYEGCFNVSILSMLSLIDIFVQPHTVASCFEECRLSNLFALQKEKCLCFNGSLQSAEKVNSSLCRYNCRMTDETEFCGGETTFSLYSKFAIANDTQLHHRRCSYYRCDSSDAEGTLQLVADYCNSSHTFICGVEQGPINAEMVSYFSAAVRCSKIGSVVYNNDTKGKTCGNQGLKYRRNGFWASIHRYESLHYPSVHGLSHVDTSYRCQTLFVQNNTIQSSFIPCFSTKKLPFICETENVVPSKPPHEEKPSSKALSTSGLVIGMVMMALISTISTSVLVILSMKRYQKKIQRRRTTKVTYNSNMVSLEDAIDNDEIERCEKEFQQEHKENQQQRHAVSQDASQENTSLEYDFVKSPNIKSEYPPFSENAYDNNGENMYYEMSQENEEHDDVMSIPEGMRVSLGVGDSSSPIPEYLEGVYDTAVANIVHDNTIKRSANSDPDDGRQSIEILDTNESFKDIPYEPMNPPNIREDNYKEMTGIELAFKQLKESDAAIH